MTPCITGIGIMSGTSLDGIDLAWCGFSEDEQGRWHYEVQKADTFPYAPDMRERLAHATELSALEYCRLDIELGNLIADCVNDFVGDGGKPAFIASHGHTVFHQPHLGLTTQIGSGAVIAARTGIPTVCDFRVVDVALHGQGAPLVPVGDELLFGEYDACLNLGGFSNISYRRDGRRVAFDVSPCNMALNMLAAKVGLEYDKDGAFASTGEIVPSLLHCLDTLEYYALLAPKSLGKEWFEKYFRPLLEEHSGKHEVADAMRTVVEHISGQIGATVPGTVHTMLVTGGGALNNFLVQRIQACCDCKLVVPDMSTVQFKEAIVFAFLGLLRLQHRENTLRSVTGADVNSCGGCIWRP
ncbi:MAG: anhydro-N-acetylmuramic acid kinase [Bacteroidales bacterium]|nr:anhydro-N-acetylmuramic acid kinase [Bacteroidales bacterium]